MSLPACQERILHGMEAALRTREPRLASLFAIFTRLTRDEEIPRTEQLEPLPRLSWHRLRRGHGVRSRRRAGTTPGRARAAGPPGARPAARLRALLLIPVLLIVVASALLAGGLSSARSCGELPVHLAAAVPVKGQTCAVAGAATHGGHATGQKQAGQSPALRP
jgi:hypothetical protein